MIKEKWKKWTRKRENGSVIVESCIVFPVVFFVIAFIIYLGNAYFQTAQVDDCVERAAIKGAQCIINPQQYDTVNNGKVPLSIQNVEPYRYIFGELPGASISEIETKIGEDCIKDIEQKTFSFFNNMKPRLSDSRKVAEFNNYVLYSTFQVQVSYEIHFPIRFIFLDDPVVMKFQSRAEVPVNDTPEFIRNVDLVVDLFHGTELAHKITDSFTKVRSFIDNFGGFGGGSGGTSGGPGDTNGIVSGGGTGGDSEETPPAATPSTSPATAPPVGDGESGSGEEEDDPPIIMPTQSPTSEPSSSPKAEDNSGAIVLVIKGKTITLNEPSDVWKLDARTRGLAIEKMLANEEYADWWNCGAEDGGYFPVVDFQKDLDVVSLKTIDPTLKSYKNGKGTDKVMEYIEALDRNITIDGNKANRILDVRIPKGTKSYLNIEAINRYAAEKGITVIIKEF